MSRVWRWVRCRWFKRHDWINPGDNEICSVCGIPAYGWPFLSRRPGRLAKPPIVEIQP